MLETAEGEKIGESLTAAKQGIGMVTEIGSYFQIKPKNKNGRRTHYR